MHATPEVRAEALPFLRMMFVCSIGMLLFFMLGGALRAAGDARTPLRLGIALTVLNIALNVVLIPGIGTDPGVRHAGAAIGTSTASALVSGVGLWLLLTGRLGRQLPARDVVAARLDHHPLAVPVRPAGRASRAWR